MLEELKTRGGLRRALQGKDENALELLMSFIIKYIANPRYSILIAEVATVILKLYAPALGRSMAVDDLFYKLQNKLRDELSLQRELFSLLGAVDLVKSTNTLQ